MIRKRGDPNLKFHSEIVFRDGSDRTSQIRPFTMYDSVDPEDQMRTSWLGYQRQMNNASTAAVSPSLVIVQFGAILMALLNLDTLVRPT